MPNMIPVMTGAGVIVFFGVITATWPVWGILTPLYMIIHFFGATMVMVLLPSGVCGNLIFWLTFGVGGYFLHNLPHEPEW